LRHPVVRKRTKLPHKEKHSHHSRSPPLATFPKLSLSVQANCQLLARKPDLGDDVDYYRLHLSHSRSARANSISKWPWHASCIRSDEQAAGELTAMRQVNGGCDGESDRILRSGLFPENS
jgi:hypothetical protein